MVALLTAVPMVVVPALASAAASAGTADTTGTADVESAFTARVASERQAAGRTGLVVEDDLVAVARRHSATMAAGNRLHHNPDLGQQVQEWVRVGENVGTGHGVDEVHAALMASSQHRGEILDPRFTGVGVGVVRTGEVLWVTEVFRQRAPAPPPAPSAMPVAPSPPAPSSLDAAAVAPGPPLRPAPAARVRGATLVASAAVTTTTSAPTTTTTTTITTPAPPALPPEVTLDPVVAAASSPLPVTPALPAAGVLAAALLWMVVAGIARVTIRLQPRLA